MYSIVYDKTNSCNSIERYYFTDKNNNILTSRYSDLPIELVIYHNCKEYMIYRIYTNDETNMNNIFECIYNNYDYLNIEEYEIRDVTLVTQYYIEYIKRKRGLK